MLPTSNNKIQTTFFFLFASCYAEQRANRSKYFDVIDAVNIRQALVLITIPKKRFYYYLETKLQQA